MFDAIARTISRHPWRVVVAGVAFAAVCGVFGGPVAGLLQGGGFNDPASQSTSAASRLEAATGIRPDGGVIIVVKTGQAVTTESTKQEVDRVTAIVAADPGVKVALSYFTTQSSALVSNDGTETLVIGELRSMSDTEAGVTSARIQRALAGDPAVRVGGFGLANTQVQSQVSADLARAEELAFPILFLLSLWVFRGAVAALLPLLVGGVTILGSFLGLRLVTLHTPMSIFALNLVTGMGLGLAIDYSLFMVSRFREELAAGRTTDEALRRTLNTSGRTILFSSLTVAAAIASLTVFPEKFLYSMGVGGVLVALVACGVSLLLLPAVLKLLGPRVNALAPRSWQRPLEVGEGFWYRLSHFVIRRQLPVAIGGAALLLILGLPFTGIKFTTVDASVLPASASSRQVSDILGSDFPVSARSTVYVIADAPTEASAQIQALVDQIKALPAVTGVDFAPAGTGHWRLDVHTRDGGLAASTLEVVKGIRSLQTPLHLEVGGSSAAFIDLQANLAARLPAAITIVITATVLLLFLMTGSLLLPLKAVVMNALTLSAAFGVLVLIFQDGNLTGLLNFTSQGALESTQPVLLFAIVFGLSTDYGVFLLSRIKEAHDGGESNSEAVAIGLGRTGRVVTAAALLFCVAIGAFATSQIVFIKELGIGVAAGVILDATIVRALLVPSLMGLLGKWNWWAPSPLRRLHSRIGFSEAVAPT
ncbi:MAG: MMPL family transporter [Candidatus Dormibacteraeota bacterium]|nr:MMPL family transporter [Candidatus Dormibacteraeota bacterium]